MNYLLIGQEEYLKHQFICKLKKSLADKGAPDFEIFRAGQSDMMSILDSVSTFPFISKNRITVIKDAENFTKEEKNSLLKHLKTPLESVTLVFTSSSRESNGFLNELSRFVKIIRCEKLKSGELATWIKKEFSSRGKSISITLASLLMETAKNDLFLLENEIEKIATFAGSAASISQAHMEAVMGKADYITGFELADVILEKNIGRIFSYLENLSTRESPQKILGLITWQFRIFAGIKNLPKGFSLEKICGILHINPAFARIAMEKARGLNKARLESHLEMLMEADLFMKTGKMNERDALERALVKLCG